MPPEPTDLNDLAAIARTTKSARYRRALASATSEIERLRAELGQVSDADAFVSETDAMILDSMVNEIERLRAERDEARRLVCRHTKKTYRTLKEMAEERGWDCFDKEPTDDR